MTKQKKTSKEKNFLKKKNNENEKKCSININALLNFLCHRESNNKKNHTHVKKVGHT